MGGSSVPREVRLRELDVERLVSREYNWTYPGLVESAGYRLHTAHKMPSGPDAHQVTDVMWTYSVSMDTYISAVAT